MSCWYGNLALSSKSWQRVQVEPWPNFPWGIVYGFKYHGLWDCHQNWLEIISLLIGAQVGKKLLKPESMIIQRGD
jgi:hypothetical protein